MMKLGIKIAAMATALMSAGAALLITSPYAHAAPPYENTTPGTIDGSVACGTSSFTRVINVPDSFTIADVDVGFMASHSWRGDIRVDLTHGGVTRRIITADTSASGDEDNYSVLLDDEAGNLIRTAPHTTNDSLAPPNYQNIVQPNNSLDVFDGQNASGDWTFTICDSFAGQDDGNFLRANLFLTSTSSADVSFDLSSTPVSPAVGSNVTLTAQITNSGPVSTSGLTGRVTLPPGLTFVSATGGASHSAGLVTWAVPGSLASGASNSITITANIGLGAYDVTGEITASAQPDTDSTPNNGILGEDDDDMENIVPAVSPPPTLSCAGSETVHDWDVYGWTDGAMTQTNTTSGETLTMTLSGDVGFLQPDPVAGGALPTANQYMTGGLLPAEDSILLFTNYDSDTNQILVTGDIGVPGIGVEELQFAVFDADDGGAQFKDRITVRGFLDGASVAPILSRSNSNVISGNSGVGISPAASDSADGTLTITFQSPIDKFELEYGTGAGGPMAPGQQAVSIHDISTCERQLAVLDAQKTTAIWDPSGLGLYAIPGNDVIYTFTVNNTGNGATDLDSVVLIDVMPPEIEFYNGDIDDASGPETHPVSFSQTDTPSLTFDYANDVKYSNSTSGKPANFAACTYTPMPVGGYDPAVTYICLNPSGTFAAGTPNPQFQINFRARIK